MGRSVHAVAASSSAEAWTRLYGEGDEDEREALERFTFEGAPVRRSSDEDEITRPWELDEVPTLEDFERRYG